MAETVQFTYEFGMRGDAAVSRSLSRLSGDLMHAKGATDVLAGGMQALARTFNFAVPVTVGVMAVKAFVGAMQQAGAEFEKFHEKINKDLSIDFSKVTLKNVDSLLEKIGGARKEIDAKLNPENRAIPQAQLGMGNFLDKFYTSVAHGIEGAASAMLAPRRAEKVKGFFDERGFERGEDGRILSAEEVALSRERNSAKFQEKNLQQRKLDLQTSETLDERAKAKGAFIQESFKDMGNAGLSPLTNKEKQEKYLAKNLDKAQEKDDLNIAHEKEKAKAAKTLKHAEYDLETAGLQKKLFDKQQKKLANQWTGENHTTDFQKMGGLGARGGGGRVGPTEEQQLQANITLRQMNKNIEKLQEIISNKGFPATVGQ